MTDAIEEMKKQGVPGTVKKSFINAAIICP